MSNFSNGRQPAPSDKIVYIGTSCDLLHPGVINRLKIAKEQGDFLYVGLCEDEMIRYYRGSNYPLQSCHERTLMALACRYADEVIIGAPYILTNDLINTLNIHKVVNVPSSDDKVLNKYADIDPYATAKAKGIYVEIEAPEGNLTIEDIAMRVYANKAEL